MTTRIVNKSSTLLSDTSKENSPKDLQNPENPCILNTNSKEENTMDFTAKRDISRYQMDNKLNNLTQVSKPSVLSTICEYFNAYTDDSLLYVPFKEKTISITKRNNCWEKEKYRKETMQFHAPNAFNNYADLAIHFFSGNTTKYIKICRVDTLHAIPFDGHLLTYAKDSAQNSISQKNYFMFYSVNLSTKEVDKLLIMSSDVYFFLSKNNTLSSHIKIFDYDDLEALKAKCGFNDSMIKLLDTKEGTDSIDDNQLLNIEIKRGYIIDYIEKILKLKAEYKSKIVYERTHFGLQSTAFNLVTGQIVQFRDCPARNNYFKNIENRELPSDKVVRRNIRNMQNIILGKDIESYKVNLYDDGWVILEHYSDIGSLLTAVEILIKRLYEKSKRLAKRIEQINKKIADAGIIISKETKEIAKNFMEHIGKIKKEISNIRNNLRSKVKYFVSMKWFFYRLNHDFPTLKEYRTQLIC